jgi:hypothetical protein
MGTLPKRFLAFPNDQLRETHYTMINSRNSIYAHTDASAKPYSITVNVKLAGQYYSYGYQATELKLRGIVFPKLIELCDWQIKNALEMFTELLGKYIPAEDIGTILKAERATETIIEIFWPKH